MKVYIATYDNKESAFNFYWNGHEWVKGVGNAKRFESQNAARTEGRRG
jgi:hypothetical protein